MDSRGKSGEGQLWCPLRDEGGHGNGEVGEFRIAFWRKSGKDSTKGLQQQPFPFRGNGGCGGVLGAMVRWELDPRRSPGSTTPGPGARFLASPQPTCSRGERPPAHVTGPGGWQGRWAKVTLGDPDNGIGPGAGGARKGPGMQMPRMAMYSRWQCWQRQARPGLPHP